MQQLILLLGGTVILAALSQNYYPHRIFRWDDKHFLKQRTDVFLLAIIIWIAFFVGLRTEYNDTYAYRRHFGEAPIGLTEFLKTEETGYWDKPFFYGLQAIFRGISSNYHIWFMFVAAMNSVTLCKLFKSYSAYLPFSFLIYFSLGTFAMYLAAMKQAMAVSILMFAIPYLIKKKYIPYYLLVFLAVGFHTHAIVYLALPLLFGKPWGTKTKLLVVAVGVVILNYNSTLGAVLRYAESLGIDMHEEEVFGTDSLNVIRVLVYAIPPLLMLLYRENLFRNSTEAENLFANMTIMSCLILAIGTVEGGNLFGRMAGYFEWAAAISLPWCINKMFEKRVAWWVFLAAEMLYFIYFIYEMHFTKDFGGQYRAITVWEFIQSLFVGG